MDRFQNSDIPFEPETGQDDTLRDPAKTTRPLRATDDSAW
jgi:hypothetical protein